MNLNDRVQFNGGDEGSVIAVWRDGSVTVEWDYASVQQTYNGTAAAKRLTVVSSKKVLPFKAGDTVYNPSYGQGTVRLVEATYTTVTFPRFGVQSIRNDAGSLTLVKAVRPTYTETEPGVFQPAPGHDTKTDHPGYRKCGAELTVSEDAVWVRVYTALLSKTGSHETAGRAARQAVKEFRKEYPK